MEPEGELPAASRTLFLELVRQSNTACQARDFAKAVALYSEALQLDPNNHVLFSNRSAARLKMGQFAAALQDAARARELNPKWPKVSRQAYQYSIISLEEQTDLSAQSDFDIDSFR